LVKEGFCRPLPYINADPVWLNEKRWFIATILPLASPGGSQENANNVKIIIENSGVPVVVDAGIGTPNENSISNGKWALMRCLLI